MRIHYYEFPDETPEETLLENGCAVILKTGDEIYPKNIPEKERPLVDYIDRTISGISIKHAKELLKEYGGCAWTCHFDRDGSLFETTDIKMKGNNSRVKYNRHL